MVKIRTFIGYLALSCVTICAGLMPILAQAKIYRFPVEAEVKPLERPAKGLEKLPKVFRVLYSNHYNAPAFAIISHAQYL